MATEQSVQDGAVEVEQDKSMARLAGILEAADVDVLGHEEASCCRPQRLHWGGMDFSLKRMEKLVENSGYQIARIQLNVYEYEKEKTGLPWTYNTLEFVSS